MTITSKPTEVGWKIVHSVNSGTSTCEMPIGTYVAIGTYAKCCPLPSTSPAQITCLDSFWGWGGDYLTISGSTQVCSTFTSGTSAVGGYVRPDGSFQASTPNPTPSPTNVPTPHPTPVPTVSPTPGPVATPVPTTGPPVTFALLHSWDFRGIPTSALITDSVGGIGASLYGGASRTATGTVLDGTDDYIGMHLNAVVMGGPMTFEIVLKWHSFNSNSRIFDCGNGGAAPDSGSIKLWTKQWNGYVGTCTNYQSCQNDGPTGCLQFCSYDSDCCSAISPTGSFDFSIYQGSKASHLSSPSLSELGSGIRYHMVAAVSGTTMSFYINGVKKGETTGGWEPHAMTRSQCHIGGFGSTDMGGSLAGEVSSLKIYAGAMTQAQVTAAYEAAFPFIEFYWIFRGASADTITDSAAGIDATLHGGTTRTVTGVVFDGVDGYADLNLGAKIMGGAMTIVGVIKWNVLHSDARLFDCGNGMQSDNIVVSNVGTSGQLNWGVYHQGGVNKAALSPSASDIVVGVRYQIVTTVSGTTMISYIDGVKKGQQMFGLEPTALNRAQC